MFWLIIVGAYVLLVVFTFKLGMSGRADKVATILLFILGSPFLVAYLFYASGIEFSFWLFKLSGLRCKKCRKRALEEKTKGENAAVFPRFTLYRCRFCGARYIRAIGEYKLKENYIPDRDEQYIDFEPEFRNSTGWKALKMTRE